MTNPGTQFKKGNKIGVVFKAGVAANPKGNSLKLRLFRAIKKVLMNSPMTQDEIKTLLSLKS